MNKLLNVLIIIILILIIAIIGAVIGKCSCAPSGSDPIPTASAVTTPSASATTFYTPEIAPTSSSGSSTQSPVSTFTPEITAEPTQAPTSGGVDANGIAYAPTEGTLNDVYARLEQLKALPDDKIIVLLDVGHGGFDPGSIGVDTDVCESDLNLEIARLTAMRLGEKGYYVFMTRMGDYALANSKNADMQERTRIMKLDIFDVAVSIHMNSFPADRSVKGTRLYQYQPNTEGERLAEIIMKKVAAITGQKYRPTVSDDLMVVREPIAPAALVECGFISHAEEERNLQTESYQLLLAQAIADGVEGFLNGEPGVE